MELLLHPEKSGCLFFFEAHERNARDIRYDDGNILFRNNRNVLFLGILPVAVYAVKDLAQTLFLFVDRFYLDIILDPREEGLFLFELLEFFLDGFDLGRIGVPVQLRPGTRLVNNVDRLVRKETVRNVPVREPNGRCDRGIVDLDLVVRLISGTKALDDVHRFLYVRRLDIHGLEASFERSVLFDMFSELVKRGRADALDLTARERRFEHA